MADRNMKLLEESSLSPLMLAETSPLARRIARSLVILFLLLCVLLAFTPWQQNVRGFGRVVAYAPTERQQVITATVEGRVSRWLVREGTPVKQGQILAEVRDNDPLLLERLKIEKETLLARQAAIENRAATMREQVRMAEQARSQALAAAQARVDMARERHKAAGYALEAARAARQTASLNLARQRAPGVDLSVIGAQDMGPSRDKPNRDELYVGLNVDIPLQQRVAGGRAQVAAANLQRLKWERHLLEDRVAAEVKDVLSALSAARKRLALSKDQRKAARQLEEGEQTRFDLGESTLLVVNPREMAHGDTALAAAEAASSLYKAHADYQAVLANEVRPQ